MEILSANSAKAVTAPCLDSSQTLSSGMKTLLRYWYRRRVIQNNSTATLMATIDNPRHKKALGIIALLDVDSLVLSRLMDADELGFVQNCHRYLRTRVH